MQNKRKNRKRGEKGEDGRVACPLVVEILGRTSEEPRRAREEEREVTR